MGRTYAEWEATQDKAMVAKVRAGDEAVSYTHLTLPTNREV